MKASGIKILVILGPTAAGKTGLALGVAEALGAEIISADAVAVYRGFDVGAAKPSPEERARVPHHLIDVAEPEEDFNAARYAELAGTAAREIAGRGQRVIVAGGTGLYLRAMLGGLFPAPRVDPELRRSLMDEGAQDPPALHGKLAAVDPVAAARLNPNDLVRVVRAVEIFVQTGRPISQFQSAHAFGRQEFRVLKLGLAMDRKTLAGRIETRVEAMLAQGLVAEVEGLLGRGVDPGVKPFGAIGYKEILEHLEGKTSLEEARARIIRSTKRLAKRQMTWFRAEHDIVWLDWDRIEEFIQAGQRFWGSSDEGL